MKTQKLIVLILVAMFPMVLLAHAPKKVNLKYNKEKGTLSVDAIHPVKDVNDHYVITLEIKVNGEDLETLEYTSQTSPESQEKEIKLPDLKPGDEVSVKATCNKFGSKTGSITIK
jgi:hypothetical protein